MQPSVQPQPQTTQSAIGSSGTGHTAAKALANSPETCPQPGKNPNSPFRPLKFVTVGDGAVGKVCVFSHHILTLKDLPSYFIHNKCFPRYCCLIPVLSNNYRGVCTNGLR